MKYVYLISFFSFFLLGIEAQNSGNIVYRISSERLEFKDGDSQAHEKFYDLMNSMSRIRDSLYFNLDFKDSESLFYLDKNKDTGMSNEKGYNSIVRSNSSVFYRNDETKELIEQINSDAYYLVTSSSDSLKWEISNEEKKINKYKCYKAIATIEVTSLTKGKYEKEIIAWFCPEIPINLGPKNYGGLPGLIFELKDDKLTYYIDSLNINSEAEVEVTKPTKGKVITRKEYDNKMPVITKQNFKEFIGN